jgi:hypothetical protein
MNIDLEELANRLESNYSVRRMKRFLVVETSKDVKITIMRAGNLIVKGITSTDEATEIFDEIIGPIS